MNSCQMEKWNNGIMERKNINRGFKQLRVWNNLVKFYILTYKLLSKFRYELKETVLQENIDSGRRLANYIFLTLHTL